MVNNGKKRRWIFLLPVLVAIIAVIVSSGRQNGTRRSQEENGSLKVFVSILPQKYFVEKIGGKLVKILAWYDNEWGYSNRVVDLLLKIAK